MTLRSDQRPFEFHFLSVPVADARNGIPISAPDPLSVFWKSELKALLDNLKSKDPETVRDCFSQRGFDLGRDILTDVKIVILPTPEFSLVDDVMVPVILTAFDPMKMSSQNYTLLLRWEGKWRIFGFFMERPRETKKTTLS